jgi:hypothetical protein
LLKNDCKATKKVKKQEAQRKSQAIWQAEGSSEPKAMLPSISQPLTLVPVKRARDPPLLPLSSQKRERLEVLWFKGRKEMLALEKNIELAVLARHESGIPAVPQGPP